MISFHFLHLAVDDVHFAKYFQLIERLVQQVVLQQEKGYDPDVAATKLDVKQLVQQLAPCNMRTHTHTHTHTHTPHSHTHTHTHTSSLHLVH